MDGIISGKTEKSNVEEIITSLPKTLVSQTLSSGTFDVSQYSGVQADDNKAIFFPQGKYVMYLYENGAISNFAYGQVTVNLINGTVTYDCDNQTMTISSYYNYNFKHW